MKMPLSQKKGFFAEYYLKLREAGGASCEADIAKLSACGTDDERVAYVDQLPWVRAGDADLQVQREFNGKNATVAAELKERATTAFKQKKWLEAMLLYSRCYVTLPHDKLEERSIALANRSATLYHLQKHSECLVDIRRALELEYPKELVYKLYERQARCYMALKDYPRTINAFKKCITATDDSTLPADRRSKLHLDAMTMIKMLENDPRTAKQAAKQQKLKESKSSSPTLEQAQTLPYEKEFVSDLVRIDQNPQEGRFARAASDVQVGQELLVEHPYVAVLLEKYAQTHCEFCFMRTVVPVACPGCSDVIYCSEQCQQKAAAKYHKFECGLLPVIWRSGASINNHMALRIIASKPLDYFMQLRASLDEELSLEQLLSLTKDDFRRVAHLERHQKERPPSNFFQYVLMARFLTRCLQAAGYFGSEPQSEQVSAIGGLLLRCLQFIQFNTHEVAELHKYAAEGREKSIFIGGAIYPTLALFNHSCDPGVVRYFRGNTIHINTVRPVEAGLPINENYGPIYTQDKREDRQARLKELYWFECNCDACLENWPLFDDLPRDIIRFRCEAPNNCTAVIEVPPSCNDFMIKCVTCGELTNILKGLKVMQDTEMMTRTAKRLYDTGDYAKALNKFVDLLRIMYEVLAPPFPDFCECQQHLKDCFLNLGNVYNLN
ncbi:hypothetical protein AWZ03_002964 [Drosophila navojoa]|uniref:MYND-type domain-containing protein n=1 Tax=Drosophila navojoa TaxID=7232 RepID=A0A484BRG7_DRONA|nr:SET and MYND domain-containing protein 4 [Drosophila navojoa]TDG50660.1 hypothetical protein AWZ03_002964 [Drosophila navojoa]